jgi:hypothetical protein
MAIDWEIREDEKLVSVRVDGPVEIGSIVESIVAVTGSSRFRPEFAVLVDLRTMVYAPSLAEALEIAQALTTLRRMYRSRIALVAGNAFHLRLTQMTSAMARTAGMEHRSFSDLEAAQRWLRNEDPESDEGK